MIGACYSDKDLCVLCSPVDFIQNPLPWADMIEKFESMRIAGPNFAYALLAKRMEATGRVLTNPALLCTSIAAEPIAPQTLAKMDSSYCRFKKASAVTFVSLVTDSLGR